MSRDMDDNSRRMYFLRLLSFPGLFMGSLTEGFAPGRFLIILGGIQEMFGEGLAGGRIRDGHVLVVDQHQDLLATVGWSNDPSPQIASSTTSKHSSSNAALLQCCEATMDLNSLPWPTRTGRPIGPRCHIFRQVNPGTTATLNHSRRACSMNV